MEKQTSASCILHPLLVCRGGKIQPSLKNSDEISNKTKNVQFLLNLAAW